MKKLRVYVDTSVIGDCFDPEFQVWSSGLIEDFRLGTFRLVLSDVTAAEIERAQNRYKSFTGKSSPLQSSYQSQRKSSPFWRFTRAMVYSVPVSTTICSTSHWLLQARLMSWSVGTSGISSDWIKYCSSTELTLNLAIKLWQFTLPVR
jgi:hypothetical protein